MRPILSKQISIHDFKEFYWLKKELQLFSREIGISTVGSKVDLSNRIEIFLQTGEIQKPIKSTKSKMKTEPIKPLCLDTVITEHHRCSQNVRSFFKTAIGPKFHFSTHIQSFLKNNVGKTYRDVVDAWYKEEKRKKEPSYIRNIAPQFEYNQFIRDYFSDPKNIGKSRQDSIKAWNIIKQLPGNNIYTSEN